MFKDQPRSQGKVDEDIGLEHDEHYPDYGYPPPWLPSDNAQREEYIGFVNPWLEGMGEEEPFPKDFSECDTQEITVPVGYGNIYPVKILVHTPKNL